MRVYTIILLLFVVILFNVSSYAQSIGEITVENYPRSVDIQWDAINASAYNLYISSDRNCDINNYTLCQDGAAFMNISSPFSINDLENGRFNFQYQYSMDVSAGVPTIAADILTYLASTSNSSSNCGEGHFRIYTFEDSTYIEFTFGDHKNSSKV